MYCWKCLPVPEDFLHESLSAYVGVCLPIKWRQRRLHPSCGHVVICVDREKCGNPSTELHNGLREFTHRKTAARRVRCYGFPVTQRGQFYWDSISITDMGAAKVFSRGMGGRNFACKLPFKSFYNFIYLRFCINISHASFFFYSVLFANIK